MPADLEPPTGEQLGEFDTFHQRLLAPAILRLPVNGPSLGAPWSRSRSTQPHADGISPTLIQTEQCLEWSEHCSTFASTSKGRVSRHEPTAKEEGGLAKWRLRLAEFDVGVVYRPGVKRSELDNLSRVETTNGGQGALEDEIPYFAVDCTWSHGWDSVDGDWRAPNSPCNRCSQC